MAQYLVSSDCEPDWQNCITLCRLNGRIQIDPNGQNHNLIISLWRSQYLYCAKTQQFRQIVTTSHEIDTKMPQRRCEF
jgi:hypothetical protein